MPTPRKTPITLFALPSLLLLALPACGPDEDDPRSFNEDGVWALEFYDIAGGGLEDIGATPRKNSFLLRFDPDKKVVAAATCGSDNGNATSVQNSTCRTTPQTSEFACRCFVYEHSEADVMTWTEWDPAEEDKPGGVGDPDDEESSTTLMAAVPVEDMGECKGSNPPNCPTVLFQPLPNTLFNSNGDFSSHVFTQKADSVWDTSEALQGNDDSAIRNACDVCFE